MKGSNLSYEDPFAAAPTNDEVADEAQQASAPAPAAEPTVVKAASVPAGSDGKIVQTYKEGAGFDSSWVVVHSNTIDEALGITYDPKFKELLDRTKLIASAFRGGAPAAPQNRGGGGGGQRSNAPQGATQPPAWAPPKPFDDFVYRSGVSKSGYNVGETWHAWMPPTRDDPQGRKPQYFKNPN